MKIASFVQTLLPSISKDTVLQDCIHTITELKEITAPSYHSAAEQLSSWKFKNPKVESLIGEISNRVSVGPGGLFKAIARNLDDAVHNLTRVRQLIEKTYNEEVTAEGITYQKAMLLQFVEAGQFASKYARLFLNYVYCAETEAVDPEAASVADSFTRFELEFIEQNSITFGVAINALATPENKLAKHINEMPDVVVTAVNAQTLPTTLGSAKMDPLMLGFIPVWMNPIYHLRMALADWQHARYKQAEEDKKLIALRLLNLQRISDGKPDARVQKEIAYLERRSGDLAYQMQKFEDKAKKAA